jgi:hypothetical protein
MNKLFLIVYEDKLVSLYPIMTRVLTTSPEDAIRILKDDLGLINIISIKEIF